MRNPFAAVARAISDLIAPGDEVRAKQVAAPLALPFPVVAIPEAKPGLTFSEFWRDHHLPFLETRRVSTRRQHVYRWQMWIEPALGHLRLSEITAPTIAQFTTGMRRNARVRKQPDGRPLAPQTIHVAAARHGASHVGDGDRRSLGGLMIKPFALDLVSIALNIGPYIAVRRWWPHLEPIALVAVLVNLRVDLLGIERKMR